MAAGRRSGSQVGTALNHKPVPEFLMPPDLPDNFDVPGSLVVLIRPGTLPATPLPDRLKVAPLDPAHAQPFPAVFRRPSVDS